MTRRVVCPGSFDPVTVGHLDIIRRAAALFDEVVVAILHNPSKSGTCTIGQRIVFIEGGSAVLANVRVAAFGGQLIVDVCRKLEATAILKGLRSESDYAYEVPMALMNRQLTGIETLFIQGDAASGHISSSLVKEISGLGGEIRGMVPDPVRDALYARRPGA